MRASRSPSYNRVLGFECPSSRVCLGLTEHQTDLDNVKAVYKQKLKNARTPNERILYEKKLSDAQFNIIDAIDFRKCGSFTCFVNVDTIEFNIFKQCIYGYGPFIDKFKKRFAQEVEYSLGINNANIFLSANEREVRALQALEFRQNNPTELAMKMYGFSRKPEYSERYAVILNEMVNLKKELTTRVQTDDSIADIKRRAKICKDKADALNNDRSLLLSVEERFRAHYSSCGPGIAELAIAELIREQGGRDCN